MLNQPKLSTVSPVRAAESAPIKMAALIGVLTILSGLGSKFSPGIASALLLAIAVVGGYYCGRSEIENCSECTWQGHSNRQTSPLGRLQVIESADLRRRRAPARSGGKVIAFNRDLAPGAHGRRSGIRR
jgi:hypothetical protein